jgi:hypothetical protein
MGRLILAEVSLVLEKVILAHCAGNVIVANFHQIDRRLQIASGVGHVRRKDPSPTIDGDGLSTVRGDGGCSRDIG